MRARPTARVPKLRDRERELGFVGGGPPALLPRHQAIPLWPSTRASRSTPSLSARSVCAVVDDSSAPSCPASSQRDQHAARTRSLRETGDGNDLKTSTEFPSLRHDSATSRPPLLTSTRPVIGAPESDRIAYSAPSSPRPGPSPSQAASPCESV